MTKEEAIEVYNGLINTKIKEAFEFFVPELRESENERIRKELIDQLQYIIPEEGEYNEEGLVLPQYHERINRYRDYLEKQKEQKPIDIDFVAVWLRKHIKTYINSEYNEFHKAVEYDGSIDIERLIEDLKKAIEQWNLKEE